MIESAAPPGSRGARSGSREAGIKYHPHTTATTTIGTFTRKIEPNQKCSSSHPLMTGPITPAIPVKMAKSAIAFARSDFGKTFTRMASVDGMMNAAAMPMIARHPTSSQIELDSAANAAPIMNATRPSCRAVLRPNRSLTAAAGKRSPAKTKEYAATTHWRAAVLAWRSRERVGTATLTFEFPPSTTSRLRPSTTSVHQRLAYSASWREVAAAEVAIRLTRHGVAERRLARLDRR